MSRAGDLAHTPAGLLPVDPVHDGEDGAVVLRPEMLDLVDTGSAVGAALDPWAGVLAGTVVGARYEGGTCLVRVRLERPGDEVVGGVGADVGGVEGHAGFELRVRAPIPPPPGAAVTLRLRGAVPFVPPYDPASDVASDAGRAGQPDGSPDGSSDRASVGRREAPALVR